MAGRLISKGMEKIWKEMLAGHVTNCPRCYMDGMRKPTETLSQGFN